MKTHRSPFMLHLRTSQSTEEEVEFRLSDANKVVETWSVPKKQINAVRTKFLTLTNKNGALTAIHVKSVSNGVRSILLPRSVESFLLEVAEHKIVELELFFHDHELFDIPWEAACIGMDARLSVSLHPNIQIVRRLQFPIASVEPSLTTNLRALLVLANPKSTLYPNMPSSAGELISVEMALRSGECRQFETEVLRYATKNTLLRTLTDFQPHVVHFIGHGDLGLAGGFLVLESDTPREHQIVQAGELAGYLAASKSEILVLSGCFTGGLSYSIGSQLAYSGIPAVVGMQCAVGDASAHLFSRAFYAALSEGFSVQESLFQGRSAISGTVSDWMAPVLMLSQGENSYTLSSRGHHRTQAENLNNLPSASSPFVGRSSEIKQVRSVLHRERLVTLTGMGGIGKSRLALEVARQSLPSYSGGVWWIACEGFSSSEEWVAAIANTLSLSSASLTDLAAELPEEKLLVVCDCLEGLSDAANGISTLLRLTRNVTILATSRIVLGSPEEFEVPVPQLAKAGKLNRTHEGIDLFLSAARSVRSDLHDQRVSKRDLRDLVNHLEGLPLALILAASRLRHMTFLELSGRLRDQRLSVLTRFPHQALDRHASLMRVISDSFMLLESEVRCTIIDLSIFEGGFSWEDAVAVLSLSGDLLTLLSTLRDHSLLSLTVEVGKTRYRILDSIREFVVTSHLNERTESLPKRHALHFLSKAKLVAELWAKERWNEAKRLLWQDLGNYRTALINSQGQEDQSTVLEMAVSLARPLLEAGAHSEATLMVTAALPGARLTNNLPALLELTGLAGAAARRAGDLTATRLAWEDRAEIALRGRDIPALADTLLDLTDLAVRSGELNRANDLLSRFERETGESCPIHLRASQLVLKARLSEQEGQKPEAIGWCFQAASLLESIALETDRFYVQITLAELYRDLGRLDEAKIHAREMTKLAYSSEHLHFTAFGLLELAACQTAQQLYGEATATLSAVVAMPRLATGKLRARAELQILALPSIPAFKVDDRDWKAQLEDVLQTTEVTTLL